MLYKDAGVDIDTLNSIKKSIGRQVTKTYLPGIKSEYGLFGGTFPYDRRQYIVGSVDSVGTKILVACGTGIHNTVGQDIVNHCINDILTTGAMPLFFMDYIGFSLLEKNTLLQIVKGVADACRKEKMLLLGGETAQLTRFYPKGIYDLVGFIIGRVGKKNYIDPQKISAGDLVVGFASSGLHTNGYSLARKVLLQKYTFSTYLPELKCTVGEELLKIHRSYRRELENRLPHIKGLAHITGGGFYDNIKRILPAGLAAVIVKKMWTPLAIFKLIQKMGNVPDAEMYRVFNMGIGMVAVIGRSALKYFRTNRSRVIGEIVKDNFGVKID